MNRAQTSRLFIADTSNGLDFLVLPESHKRYGALIAAALGQQLKSRQDWEILGRSLVTVCQYARAAGQVEVLREVSNLLVSLPLRQALRGIGLYYQAWVLHKTGEYGAARVIFEQLATDPQFPWKPRAIASIAACHFHGGDLDTATRFYLEASHAARTTDADLPTVLNSQWMIGRIWSVQGDHDIALKSLENLEPLVEHVAVIHPAVRYDYLNSRAVRLIALNRLDEAEHLNRITLASPYVKNFAYFYDTRDEIQEKREATAATVLVNVQPDLGPRCEAFVALVASALAGVILYSPPQGKPTAVLPSKPISRLPKLLVKKAVIADNRRPRSPPGAETSRVCAGPLPFLKSVAVADNHRPRAPPITCPSATERCYVRAETLLGLSDKLPACRWFGGSRRAQSALLGISGSVSNSISLSRLRLKSQHTDFHHCLSFISRGSEATRPRSPSLGCARASLRRLPRSSPERSSGRDSGWSPSLSLNATTRLTGGCRAAGLRRQARSLTNVCQASRRLSRGVGMGVLIVDCEPDSNGLLIGDSEMEELVKEMRLRDSWEARVSLMVAAEAVRSHLHERSGNNNLLLVRRLARDKHGRRYKQLMERVAKAMEKGPRERVAALQTIERVMTLAFESSPDTTTAKQKYKTMLSEITRAQREEGDYHVGKRTKL